MTREEFLTREIESYRKKIELYQAMIAEWERELGKPGPLSAPVDSSSTSPTKKPAGGDPLSLIQGMVFFGKSQPEAAKAFLQMVGYPLGTQVLVDGIIKGGVKIGGKDPKQNLYTILERSPDFGRVGRGGIWGLTSWPGVAKKNSESLSEESSSEDASS
ncbi:MAG TPA: hypothetical protein VHX37_13185 [Acidobacteriaceae bacterium]|jgi:hypothetical protein|nr:hypothetical protein [Acidobacteriaceae bacterium]